MAKSNSSVSTLDDADDANVAAETVATITATKVSGAGHDAALSGERKTITIHATDGEGGSDAVNMGLNGMAYQLPRGVPCDIPVELFEVLKNAKTMRMVQQPGGAIKETVAQRYSYVAE